MSAEFVIPSGGPADCTGFSSPPEGMVDRASGAVHLPGQPDISSPTTQKVHLVFQNVYTWRCRFSDFLGRVFRTPYLGYGWGVDVEQPRPPGDADRFAFEAGRAVIEQAKGMLMLVYGIGEQQAFELLRSCSQHTNVRLRELAGRILTELPTVGRQVPTAPLRVELNRILAGHPPPTGR
ncbi:ANTAR domain-containing protein [Nocardia beijingensis]|uniref:ANTAR domain-containing protein n=1 Tax=Nocardia beijingensis TaxID=95162 RepID=UPI00332B68D7